MADDVLAWADSLGGNDDTPKKKPQPDDLLGWADGLSSPPRSKYDSLFEKHGQANNLDPDLLRAMTGQESTFKPNAISPKGAEGLMQLMPGTARRFGVTNVYDPDQNIRGGAEYMKFLLDRYNGDVPKALAGYNAGEGAVDKYKGIPPFRETQNYVKKITGKYKGSGYAPAVDENAVWGDVNSLLGTNTDQVNNAAAGPDKLPPIVPTPQVPTEPAQTLQTPTGIADAPPPLIATPPVAPEAPNTIAAQIGSAQDPASPRAGVLTTSQEQNAAFGSVSGFQAFATPQGTLWVNTEKAKKLKLKSPQDIQTFITKNPDGVTRLIGKVDNVADTSTGPALVTKDANGNELSSSIVTSPKTAAAQAQVDKAQFPQAVTQEVKPAQAVVNDRVNQQAQQISTGNSTTVQPTTQQPVFDLRAFKQANAYLKSQGQPLLTKEQFLATQVNQGNVEIPTDSSDYSVDGSSIPASDITHDVATGQTIHPREIGKPTDDVNREIGTTGVDPKSAPEDKLRAAMNAQLSQYGVTPQEIDGYLKSPTGQKEVQGIASNPNVSKVGVTFNVLQTIKGPDAAKYAIRSEQAQNYNPLPNLAAPAKPNFEKEDAETLNQNLGTLGNVLGQAVGTAAGSNAVGTGEAGQNFGESLAGFLGEFGNEFVGKTDKAAAGLMRALQYWSPTSGRSMQEAAGLKPYEPPIIKQLQDVANSTQEFANHTGNDGTLSWAFKTGGSLAGATPRIMMMSALPGGIVMALPLDAGLQSYGGGSTGNEALLQAGKQVPAALAFGFAPKAARAVLGKWGLTATEDGVARTTGRAIAEEGTTLGTIGGTSYVAARAFGDTPEDALKQALMNAGFHAFGQIHKIVGKVPFTIRARTADGDAVAAQVDPDGKVTTIDPSQPADVEAFVPKMSKQGIRMDETGFKPLRHDVEVPETPAEPEKTQYTSQLDEIRQNNATTKKQIQALFPDANLSNEQAAELRQQAWGEEPQNKPNETNTQIPSQPAQVAETPNISETKTSPSSEPAAAEPNAAAPDTSQNLDTYKKAFELPLLKSKKESKYLGKQIDVTFESESGKTVTRSMKASDYHARLENKGKVLKKLLECIHA